jgi:ectoine hydroxylase-related dioxygenase (phytanoyl-CoA dioxygenase family)
MTHPRICSAAELAAYRRDGFLVCRQLFDEDEVAELRRFTAEVERWPEVPGAWMVYGESSLREPGRRLINRIENFCPYHAGFKALVASDRLQGRVEDLLGEPAVLFKDKINFKLPGGHGFEPHQDQQAGWSAWARLFVTALVAIDEATEANGCLELAAGHHTRGLLGPEWTPLGPEHLEGVAFVACPTAPGDAIFFDSYVPHRSGPNLSDRPRRALYVTYNRRSEGDHRERYYAEKRTSYPPDVEREPGRTYVYRV